jgi:hypothetical protein
MQTCLKQRWATNEMTVKAYCYYKMSGAVETSTTTELVSKKYYHYRIVLMLSHCTRAISLMLTIKDHAQRKCLTTHREKLQWQQIVLSVHPDKVEDHQIRPNLSEFPKSN